MGGNLEKAKKCIKSRNNKMEKERNEQTKPPCANFEPLANTSG